MTEQWRSTARFDAYEVSSLGRVRRRRAGKTGAKVGHVLKPWRSASGDGYLTVTLCASGKKSKQAVHILVCTAFHGEKPSPLHEVAHKNGRKLDCSESNVRWALRAENHADKIGHGTDNRGQKHGMARLTDEAARIIKDHPRGRGTGVELALKFGVSQSLISMVRSGKVRSYDTESPSI